MYTKIHPFSTKVNQQNSCECKTISISTHTAVFDNVVLWDGLGQERECDNAREVVTFVSNRFPAFPIPRNVCSPVLKWDVKCMKECFGSSSSSTLYCPFLFSPLCHLHLCSSSFKTLTQTVIISMVVRLYQCT